MPEHYLSLSVGTSTPEQWNTVYLALTALAKELFPDTKYVSVSSSMDDDEDEEKLRPLHEETMFRVSAALRERE